MRLLLLPVLAAWLVAHTDGYCRDNPPTTTAPSTTLIYYKNPQDSTKSIFDKCKPGVKTYRGPPMDQDAKNGGSFSTTITFSTDSKASDVQPGYMYDKAVTSVKYDTSAINTTVESMNTISATVSMYTHTSYVCVKFFDINGMNASLSGNIKATLTVPKSAHYPDGMVTFGFDERNEVVALEHPYDVGGRTGPQILSIGQSIEPKMAMKGNTHEIKYVYGATARLLLHPFSGDPTARLTPRNHPVLKGMEFFIPLINTPAPMVPAIKEIGFNFIKLVFPLYDNAADAVEMWNYTYAPAGAEVFPCVEKAEPGKEVVLDGLTPSTSYQFKTSSTIPSKSIWTGPTGNTYGFTMMTGARGGSASEIKFVSIGVPETFRRDNTTAVVRIPASLSRGNPRVAQADVRFQDPLTNREFKRLTFNGAGVFVVPGLNMNAGFKVKYTLTDQVGFVASFNETMRIYTNETKPGAGAEQLNDDPIVIGPPVALRTGPNSFLLRLPKQISGYSPRVVGANFSVADALSREVLLPNKRRADANNDTNGTDIYFANIPSAPSHTYVLTVSTIDVASGVSVHEMILGPTDPHTPYSLGVRAQSNHHKPAFQLTGNRLELSTPSIIKLKQGNEWVTYGVQKVVYSVTHPVTGRVLGTSTLKAGAGSGIHVPQGMDVLVTTHTYIDETSRTPAMTTMDLVLRDPLDTVKMNSTMPSLQRVSQTMAVMNVPHLLSALRSTEEVPVNELIPISSLKWKIQRPRDTVMTALEASQAAQAPVWSWEDGDTPPTSGAGEGTVGEVFINGLPTDQTWNMFVTTMFDDGEPLDWTLVPAIKLPHTQVMRSEISQVMVTTHLTVIEQEMARVVVVRIPARDKLPLSMVGESDQVVIKMSTLQLTEDTAPAEEASCACVDSNGGRMMGMKPLCGSAQTLPPCDEGVTMECAAPYTVSCAVAGVGNDTLLQNGTNSTNGSSSLVASDLTRTIVMERAFNVSDVPTDHVFKLDPDAGLLDGQLLSATLHQAGKTSPFSESAPIIVQCSPTRRLQALLDLPEYQAGTQGHVEFLPTCGGMIVRVPPMVVPTYTRTPQGPFFVLSYNVTVYNMGVNGTSGKPLYRKMQLTACGATETPVKGCGLTALSLPVNVTTKVMVHLNLSEYPTDLPEQVRVAIHPGSAPNAPNLEASTDWVGAAGTEAMAGLKVFPSYRWGQTWATSRSTSQGIVVRLPGPDARISLKNVNASGSPGKELVNTTTGDNFISMPEPASNPRPKGTVGRMNMRLAMGQLPPVSIGVVDQSVVESAISLHAVPTTQGLPLLYRALPGKPGLATVRVPTALQTVKDGRVKCVSVTATISARAREGGSLQAVEENTLVMPVGQDTSLEVPAELLDDGAWMVTVTLFATYESELQALKAFGASGSTGARRQEATVVYDVSGSYGYGHHFTPVAALPQVTVSVTGSIRIDCPAKMHRESIPIVSCTIHAHDLQNDRHNLTETLLAGGSMRITVATGHNTNVTVTANPSSFDPKDGAYVTQPVPFPSLLEGPQLTSTGQPQIVPACPTLLVRLPENMLNASQKPIDCGVGGRYVLTIKDTNMQIKLNEHGLQEGSDTVVPLAGGVCCNSSCRAMIKCVEQVGRRRTVYEAEIVAPPPILLKDPTQPQAYTNSCSALTLVNPRDQRVDYVVTAPGQPTITDTVSGPGVFPVGGLEAATTYQVLLRTQKSTTVTQTKTMLCQGVMGNGVDPETGELSFASDYTGQRPVVAIAAGLGGVGVNCPEAFQGYDTKRCSVSIHKGAASAAQSRLHATSLVSVGTAAGQEQLRARIEAELAPQLEQALSGIMDGSVPVDVASLNNLMPSGGTAQLAPTAAEISNILPAPELGSGPGQYATQEEVDLANKAIEWAKTALAALAPGQPFPEPPLSVAPATTTREVEIVLKLDEEPSPSALEGLKAGMAQLLGLPVSKLTITVEDIAAQGTSALTSLNLLKTSQSGGKAVVVKAMYDNEAAAFAAVQSVPSPSQIMTMASNAGDGITIASVSEATVAPAPVASAGFGSPEEVQAAMATIAMALTISKIKTEAEERVEQALAKADHAGLGSMAASLGVPDSTIFVDGPLTDLKSVLLLGQVFQLTNGSASNDFNMDYEIGDIVTNPEEPRQLPVVKDMSDRSDTPRAGNLAVTVSVVNEDNKEHTFTTKLNPYMAPPLLGDALPFVLVKAHDKVELQMQSDLLISNITTYNFMRIAYEAIEDKLPMVVYPYVPDKSGGDGSLSLQPYVMSIAPGKRYRLVSMLRRADATYMNYCIIITANRDPTHTPSVPIAAAVTSDSIIIALPTFSGLAGYRISLVQYDEQGDEHRFIVFDGELDDLERYAESTGQANAFQFTARGLLPGIEYKYAVQTLHNDGRADKINIVKAVTDTTAFECLVGRSNRVAAPVVKPGTVRSRNFSVEFEEILTYETPLKYPVQNYTIMLKYLGYCPSEDTCEVPHAPWEAVAEQVSVEALDEGINVTGIESAGASKVRSSCKEVTSSGWFTLKPDEYTGNKFKAYCDVQDDGVWLKIMQSDVMYQPTPDGFGKMEAKGTVTNNAKLSDELINIMAGKRGRLFRLMHSGSAMKLFIKTKATYNDTEPSFGFLLDTPKAKPTTFASVNPEYNKQGPWSKFEYDYIDTKSTRPVVLTGDDCNRMIIGKGQFDCFKKPEANKSLTKEYRCLNGGKDCNGAGRNMYGTLENIEMWLFQGYGCPSQCSGHGICVNSKCKCNEGYEGKACDSYIGTVHVGAVTASLVQRHPAATSPAQSSRHRLGLWDFSKPDSEQMLDDSDLSLLQTEMETAVQQLDDDPARILEASIVRLRPGSSYVVSATAFNAWGESDMGHQSKQVKLDSEPPNAVDMPFYQEQTDGYPNRKSPIRPTVKMSWRAPYHNGAPVTAFVVECSPPMPGLQQDGSTDLSVYPEIPGKIWKQVYLGLPPADDDKPKIRSIVLGETTVPNATLVPATQYSCRVRACNGPINGTKPTKCGGFGEQSEFRLRNEVPETPAMPEILDFQVDQAKFQWSKSRHNGMPITHYEVRYRTFDLLPTADGSSCGKSWQWSKANISADCPNTTETRCTATNLEAGTRYFFSVRAVNCVGPSRWSQPVKLHTPGDLPNTVTEMGFVRSTPTSVTFEFLVTTMENGAIVEGYDIESDNFTQAGYLTGDPSTTAQHCYSLSVGDGGEDGNIGGWPWCLPAHDPFWVPRTYVSHADVMSQFGCETPVSEQFGKVTVEGLHPATTYRFRVRTKSDIGLTDWAWDESKTLYQDPKRQFIIGRTSDWVPDAPVSMTSNPRVLRANFSDEFRVQWNGLCNVDHRLQGACPGCMKNATECTLPNGTVDTADCFDQCKQICRDVDANVNTSCYGVAFNAEDHYTPNCILSQIPLSVPLTAGAGFKCHGYFPENLTGTFDVLNNSYAATVSWTDTRDPEGQVVFNYRILAQNATRKYSSSTTLATQGASTEVDYERLGDINDIDPINYRVQQPFKTLVENTSDVRQMSVGGLLPDQTYHIAVACQNKIGLTDPLDYVTFKTGPGRPQAPYAPSLQSKAGFFMRVKCTEGMGLDGGLDTLGMTMQVVTVNDSVVTGGQMTGNESDAIDWTGATEEEFTYGQQLTYGSVKRNGAITVGCAAPNKLTSDPFAACLNLATKYAFRCKSRNKLGYSAWSDSAAFGTAGSPPDSLASDQLRRDVEQQLYRSGLGFKMSMDMPASNGMQLQFCDIEIGGSWSIDAKPLMNNHPNCMEETCPRVRKTYRKRVPSFEVKDENLPGYRHFRLNVRNSPGTKWCIGGFQIKDVHFKAAVPESCNSFQNDGRVLCENHEFCSSEGFTTGWVELHFEKNVDPFSYRLLPPSNMSTIPGYVELLISKTGGAADNYRMVHTAITNFSKPTPQGNITLPSEHELDSPGADVEPQVQLVTVTDSGKHGNMTHTPFLGYVDDDWLLVLSYHHKDQTKKLSPISLPLSLTEGYSHSSIAMLGLTENDISAVRLQCRSSRHYRHMNYMTYDPRVKAVAVYGDNATSKYINRPTGNMSTHSGFRRAVMGMGDFDGVVGDGWYNSSILAADHTARLPKSANIINEPGTLWNTPMEYETMIKDNRTGLTENRTVAAWSVGAAAGGRWECDDIDVNATHDGAETTHMVWVKLKNFEVEPWVPSRYETTCVSRPVREVEKLSMWEVVDGGAVLSVEMSKANTTYGKSVKLTAGAFGLQPPTTYGITKDVKTDPGTLYTFSVLARTNDNPIGAIEARDKQGNSLLKDAKGDVLERVFFDDTGKRTVTTFEAPSTHVRLAIVFKQNGDYGVVSGDTINVTVVTLQRTCKETNPGVYVPPESCSTWARLFSTNATGGDIPAKFDVANLWSQSNKILKITENYDGTGDKLYIQDNLPSFIGDPLYTPTSVYRSQDRDLVQCSNAEKWHTLKGYAQPEWDPSDPNVLASPYWNLYDTGMVETNHTPTPDNKEWFNPCSTLGQTPSRETVVPLTTWFMCADEAADYTVDPPRVPECIDNNHVAVYTTNPGVCGAPDHPTLVTLVGHPCEGEHSKVIYTQLHVVDPAPWCDLSAGQSLTSFSRYDYADPSDKPGLYYGARMSYLGSPGKPQGAGPDDPPTACGTPPSLFPDLPSAACAVSGGSESLSFVLPDVAPAVRLPGPTSPVLDDDPGECVRYCEISNSPQCSNVCDDSMRSRTTVPSMPYFFRGRCFNTAGHGDWGPWQRHVSSVGVPSQPLRPEFAKEPTSTSQMLMWDPSEQHNNPYASGFPMIYYEVSYLCISGSGCPVTIRDEPNPPLEPDDEWQRWQDIWKEESVQGCRSTCDDQGLCRNCTVNCLVPDTVYEYKVRAFNGGSYSTFSNATITSRTEPDRPTVPLKFDVIRGDFVSGGKWTSPALKHGLAKYLNATCPTPDAYTQSAPKLLTYPLTTDLFQSPPEIGARACTVNPRTFELTAAWMLPEQSWSLRTQMFKVSASLAPTWRYPKGEGMPNVPGFGPSPYTFQVQKVSGKEPLNFNETLSLAAPSNHITVVVKAISIINGVQMISDGTKVCEIIAPPADPCWDGWNHAAGECEVVHPDMQVKPELTTAFKNGLLVAIPPPKAQNRGHEDKNVYELQWKWQDVYEDQADLCLLPEETNKEECKNVNNKIVRATNMPRDEDGYRLLNFTQKDGINVRQGSEDGQMYNVRTRIQIQCDEDQMESRKFTLEQEADSEYKGEMVLYPTPDPQPNPNLPSPTPKAFAVDELVFTDRKSIVFKKMSDKANFERSYVLRVPYTKENNGFEFDKTIKLKSSVPVAVYVGSRVTGPSPNSTTYCSRFKYPGFEPTDLTTLAQTRSGSTMEFHYQLLRRTFDEPTTNSGGTHYKVDFKFSIDGDITQHATGPGGSNETYCEGADSFSFIVVTPLVGTEGCPWTRWTRWSEPMETKSLCPYADTGKCGGTALDGSTRGLCNETTGECHCHAPEAGKPTYGGAACEYEIEESMCKCVGDPHCTTADGQYFDYSGGGEMRMWHSREHPDESINVVLTKVGRVTAIGKVAFKYRGRVITVESHPEGYDTPEPAPPLPSYSSTGLNDPALNSSNNGSNGTNVTVASGCPTLRVNCETMRVVESQESNPTFSVRYFNRTAGLPESLEIITENDAAESGVGPRNSFCNGNEGQFTIINHRTRTRLQCMRWGGEWRGYFHCYLRYFRNKDRFYSRPMESGLCAYNGTRNAEFKDTLFEDLVQVDMRDSLFLANNKTKEPTNGYCITQDRFCSDRQPWDKKTFLRCHGMDGEFWLQSQAEAIGDDSATTSTSSRPRVETPVHQHVTAHNAPVSSVLSPRRRSMGLNPEPLEPAADISWLQLSSTTGTLRHHNFKQGNGLFDTGSAQQYDTLATHVASRAMNVGQGVVSSPATRRVRDDQPTAPSLSPALLASDPGQTAALDEQGLVQAGVDATSSTHLTTEAAVDAAAEVALAAEAEAESRTSQAGGGNTDVDCVGNWTECDAECKSTYEVTQERQGGGAMCEAYAGDTKDCAPGDGQCPQPVAPSLVVKMEDIACPDSLACSNESCTHARLLCLTAFKSAGIEESSSYAGCLSDVCIKAPPGGDPIQARFWVNQALKDARITIAYGLINSEFRVEAEQVSAEEQIAASVPMGGRCPDYSYGKEIWNSKTYRYTVPSWSTERLATTCCPTGVEITDETVFTEDCKPYKSFCQLLEQTAD